MHSPSARALHHLEHYYIILKHTLKHLLPDKCVINTECYLRPYQCEHCGLKDTFKSITGMSTPVVYDDVDDIHDIVLTCMSSHYDECPAYPLACPNRCGKSGIKRRDMAKHRSNCPRERVECPFAEVGCTHRLLCSQLDSHLSSNQQQHLLLVMGAYKEVKSKLTETEAKLTTAVRLLRLGNEADKEIVDSITSCSTYLTKPGDSLKVTMPRVSEYHRTGKGWYSPPFYYKAGYKMCLAVIVKKMVSGICSHVSVGVNVLEGEYDDQLNWPIGNYDHPCNSSGVQYLNNMTLGTSFKMCFLTALQSTKYQQLYCEKDISFHLVNDCLTFHIRCYGCDLTVEVGCVRM